VLPEGTLCFQKKMNVPTQLKGEMPLPNPTIVPMRAIDEKIKSISIPNI
jgi:hypothetical protein